MSGQSKTGWRCDFPVVPIPRERPRSRRALRVADVAGERRERQARDRRLAPGDLDEWLAGFAPEAEFHTTGRFPDQRVYRGRAGLEPITLHDCRHTFASLLIDSGENPKAVQEFMGHSTITVTFDLYGHLFPGSRDEARARWTPSVAEARGPTVDQ